MMSPKVSVVVPVYNVERYLKQCLDSIINQSLKDIEIICVDDGSTDGCPAILALYAEKDSRIKIITKPNSGYGNTMNVGVSHATGEYLGIVESDDYIDEYMYETLYKLGKEHDLDIAKSLFTSFDNETNDKATDKCDYVTKNKVICPSEDNSPFLLTPSIWSAVYKLSLLRDNDIKFNNTPGASYQDTAFFFKTHIMARKYMLIDKSLLFYRVSHSESSSTRIGANKMFLVLGEWKEVFRYISEKKLAQVAIQMAYVLKYSGVPWLFLRLERNLRYEYAKKIQQELKNDYPKINFIKFNAMVPSKRLLTHKLIKMSPVLFVFLANFRVFVKKVIAY